MYISIPAQSVKILIIKSLLCAALSTLLFPSISVSSPVLGSGGVTLGAATIVQAGGITNVNQSTTKAAINWWSFSTTPTETVNFNQPSSSAITLNRVIGNEKSVLEGALNATGKVFLINSNGVLFSRNSSVNVGGLVASTLNLSDTDFNAGNFAFKTDAAGGAVTNLGAITSREGGYIALLGNSVSNQGVITATKGTVSLNSGDRITLNFDGDSLISVTLDEGTLNALVENKQAIYADGGRVIMTAKAADDLLSAQVNNTGLIQARTIDDLNGSIKLYAQGGSTNVNGTLDASAPTSGDGGLIETSGDHVKIADSALVTTKSAYGRAGSWLIDPDGFTIGINGDMTGTALTTALANGSIVIASTNGSGTDGNINVNDAVSWSANTLTLNASSNIFVNNVMTATGTASFAATYGTGTNADHSPMGLYTLQSANTLPYSGGLFTGQINFSGSGSVTLNGLLYTLINTEADLVAAASNPAGNYVLGNDIAVSGNLTTLGTTSQSYTGSFNGFGHKISDTTYSSTGTGLFGTIGIGALISNIGFNANLQPDSNNIGKANSPASVNTTSIGLLADVNNGSIVNSFATGALMANNSYSAPNATVDNVGGLVGDNFGLIAGSYAAAIVQGTLNVGGFVGVNEASGTIYTSSSRFSGSSSVQGITSAIAYAGGFAGTNAGLISQSYNGNGIYLTGDAVGSSSAVISAGFAGLNTGTIDQSYAYMGANDYTAQISGAHVAGFVGDNAGTISNSYTTALNAYPQIWDSAFAYINSGTISNSYAIARAASTTLPSYGFVSINNGGTTANDYWYSGLGASSLSDNSTANSLTASQSTTFTSYNGFDTSIWGVSSQGYPILKQLPVYMTTTSSVAYGSTAGSILGSLTIAGLQGGDTVNQMGIIATASGNLDAGTYASGSVLTSSIYSQILGSLTIAPQQLTLASGVVLDKTYDGTNTGTVNNGLALGGLVGLVGNETLSIDYLTATFSDKNAGQGKTAAVTYTATDGTNGGKLSNYMIAPTTTATISPKTVTASFSAADKIYDGLVDATVTTQLPGIIPGDSVALTFTSAQFSDKNAAPNKTVTLSGLALSEADQNNYVLQSTSLQSLATITPRVVDLYGSETAANSTSFNAANIFVKNAVTGDTVGLGGSVRLAGTAEGIQPMADLSGLTIRNANYTLTGAMGAVVVGAVNLALDQVASGAATITTSGTTTTVTQSTDNAIIDWLRFSIAANETVNFVQPAATSIVLNRVTGNERSIIDGALHANGRVFILNSNGVLFSASSQVNVGALVASTLNIDDNDFTNSNYLFTASGGNGSVIAAGDIVVVDGGFVALASGGGVNHSGSLTAHGGTAVLAAANNMTLTLNPADAGLSSYALSGLAGTATVGGSVNVGSASSDGGIIETAGGKVALASNLLLNTGTNGTWSYSQNSDISIGAQGTFSSQFVDNNLAIRNFRLNSLEGGIAINDAVSWSADTTLLLSAGNDIAINNTISATGANAGFAMNFGGYAATGSAAAGSNYHINNLSVSNDGTIKVGPASVTLNGANATLSINGQAYQLIHSMADLATISPAVVDPMTGLYGPATGFYALAQDISATGTTYNSTVVGALSGTLAGLGHKISNLSISVTAIDPTINTFPDAALIDTIDPTLVSPSGTGVVRDIGLVNINVISSNSGQPGVTVNNLGGGTAGGLAASNNGTISNAYVTGTISGSQPVGGLVASNSGNIDNSHVDVTVLALAAGTDVGGLVGSNLGTITLSTAKGSVSAAGIEMPDGTGLTASVNVGGLVGINYGTIGNAHSYTNVMTTDTSYVGGLVGLNFNIMGTPGQGSITNSSASGTLTATWLNVLVGGQSYGGLVGDNNGGTISNSTSGVNVSVTATRIDPANGWAVIDYVGGLVGSNEQALFGGAGTITNSSSSGAVKGIGTTYELGGAVGNNFDGTITGVQATGNVSAGAASQSVGGLVGSNAIGTITDSSSTGNVTGGSTVGGLIGINAGSISGSSASGSVTGQSEVGGLVGHNAGAITNSTASGSVTGNSNVGGLVGDNFLYDFGDGNVANGVITGSSASGSVTGVSNVGGLAGYNGGVIESSSATGNVMGTSEVGALVGTNGGNFSLGQTSFNGTITNSNAIGSVTGSGADVGGLTGSNNGAITNSTYTDVAAGTSQQSNSLVQSLTQEIGNTLPKSPLEDAMSSVDSHIVYANSPNFSADVKSITVDGVQFDLEDSGVTKPKSKTSDGVDSVK